MLRNVLLKSLRDTRRAMMWWSIGLILLALMMMAFYPSIRESAEELEGYVEALSPEVMALFAGEITDMTSPEGFLNSQLYFLMLPLLFLIFAISYGSGATAGEEDKGTLDLLLANPVTRVQVVLEKFAAMVLATLVLAVAFWAALAIGADVVDMEIGLGRLAEATFSGVLLGLMFGTLALAVGSASGNRGLSIGISSAAGVASYFLNALAPISESIEPLRVLSPFYYYIDADPLSNGLNIGHAGLLLALTAILLAAALVTFDRRDLDV